MLQHITAPQEEPFINDRAAAEFLSVSINTIRLHTRTGVLPSYKLSGLRRYRKSELAAAMMGKLDREEASK
jgi:predicted site-specific integrase-resolvase